MPETTLSRRALSRATLARQLLLERAPVQPFEAVKILAGLQAQAPLAPHVALWSRLRDYSPASLDELYDARRVVRSNLLRATVHLVTTEDALAWQPLAGPISKRAVQGAFGKRLIGIDLEALTSAAAKLLNESALTTAELGQRLAAEFPGYDTDALAYGARGRLALIHATPRGKWNEGGLTKQTTFAAWLGREPGPAASPDDILLRYLAAFGPASVQDAQVWFGLTRLSEVAERLSPQLRTFRDEGGRTLYDLPDAPRPDEDVPAPPRFLPEYDNVFFGYADRTRFVPDLRKPPIPPGNGARMGTVFVDGEWLGVWRIALPKAGKKNADTDAPAVMDVTFFREASEDDLAATENEAAELAAFIAGPGVPTQVDIRVERS